MPRRSPLTVGVAAVCAGLGATASMLLGPVGSPLSGPSTARLPTALAVPTEAGEPSTGPVAATRMWRRAQQADVLSPPPVEAATGRPR
ncbi:MAG TPA: hypothetical protein VFE65_25225 [Pseudonocardia sp.]|jgi:hypothetical protein|nr:hypothetical protein [Pseudonocardia sp.]